MARRRHRIQEVRQAGTWHQVVTVNSTGAGKSAYRRKKRAIQWKLTGAQADMLERIERLAK